MNNIGFWKRLFHRHKWITVFQRESVATWEYVLSCRSWEETGYVVLERCDKCGKERAYFLSHRGKTSLDPLFVKMKNGIE